MNVSVKFLPHISFIELVWFRSVISLMITVTYLRSLKISVWGRMENRKLLYMRGVFGVTALSLFFYTLQKMPLATAITLQYLSPIFTAIFAILFLGERVRRIQWLWFAVAFSGILVVRGSAEGVTWGLFFAGLASAALAGAAYTVISKLKNREHPVVVVFYFPLVAIPVMSIFLPSIWQMPIGWDWLFILLMGVSTQFGQVYLTKAYQAEEASRVAIFKYLGIVFGLGFDLFLFQVHHTLGTLLGIALVIVGVVLQIVQKKSV
ncbi:MAG: DMT family transporter [Cryomorphaceae bacterium]|nr:DMT family transporter [Cryomorphaceae bacterium]